MNQVGGTTSVRYEVREESFSTSVQYVESSWLDFVGPLRSHANGGFGLIRPVQGIKYVGLHLIGSKSCEWRACPRPCSTWKQAGWISSVRYEVAGNEDLSSSIRYEESSRLHYVCLVQSHTRGELVLVRLVRGIKLAGLRPFGT